MKLLFVGGPMHGARLDVPDGMDTYAIPDLTKMKISPFVSSAAADLPEVILYRRLRWPYRVDFDEEHQEVMLGPITEDRPAVSERADDPRFAYFADRMWLARADELIPQCVVPDCAEKGRAALIADESGRLAGREWKRGDRIRLCAEHRADIYRAHGVYGRENLPKWLQADANYDPLDAYDAGRDLLFGDQIRDSRARAIRVAVPTDQR